MTAARRPVCGLLLERHRRVEVLVEHRLDDHVAGVAVRVADRDRLVDLVAPAVLLARRRADPPEHRGERDRPLEDPGRLAEVRPRRSASGSPGCRCGSGTCSGRAAGSRRCGRRRSARGSSAAAGGSPRSGSGRPSRPRSRASTRSAGAPRPRPRRRTSGRPRSRAAWARSTGSGSRSRCRGRPRGSSGPRGPRRRGRRPRSGCAAWRLRPLRRLGREQSSRRRGVWVAGGVGGGRSGRSSGLARRRRAGVRPVRAISASHAVEAGSMRSKPRSGDRPADTGGALAAQEVRVELVRK